MNNEQNAAHSVEFEALQIAYLDSLAPKLEDLKSGLRALRANALSADLQQSLKRSAHKLAGSGGSYGFPEISEAAYKLEQTLDSFTLNDDDIGVISSLAVLIEAVHAAGSAAKKSHFQRQESPARIAPKLQQRSKLLIAEDDAVIAQLLKSMMESEIDIEITANGDEVISLAERSKPDLILLDDDLPGMTGLEIVEALQSSNELHSIPVIMLTGNSDPANVMRAVKAGAKDYFTKPFEPISFINHIRSLLACKDYTVLLVDDDAAVRALLSHRFESFGIRCVEAADGVEALEKAKEKKPSLIVLDRMMPGLVGGAVLHELKNSEHLKSVPVIILTARSGAGEAHEWLKRGAVDFISKPFDPDELVLRALRVLQIEDIA